MCCTTCLTLVLLFAHIIPLDSFNVHALVSPPIKRSQQNNEIICRDRGGNSRPENFHSSACTMCFVYLFPSDKNFKTLVVNRTVLGLLAKTYNGVDGTTSSTKDAGDSNDGSKHRILQAKNFRMPNGSIYHEQEKSYISGDSSTLLRHQMKEFSDFKLKIIRPDVTDRLSLQEVCNEISESQCQRWIQCCQAAHECCERQIKTFKVRRMEKESVDAIQKCPLTWDGYSCVEETPAGDTAHLRCPSFITSLTLHPGAKASRQCLQNATWWRSPVTRMEWTDYSGCLAMDIEAMKIAQLVAISCCGLSIVCLIPTSLIFLCLRPLRCQLRIKIHICLFISMLMSSIAGLLWEWMAMYDRLLSSPSESFEHKSPDACKVVNILTRLTKTFTYFWMLCEGFHLQWLMVQSYKAFTNIILFVFIGWGVPCILLLIYVVVRLMYYDDDLCWIATAGQVEWIINGPTIACISLNFFFLLIILKTLFYQLNAHDDNMGTVRKTARALLILIPLFGLQQFVILYRPSRNAEGYNAYEIISAIIENSQGTLVALVLCVFNSEVRTHLRHSFRHWQDCLSSMRQTRRPSSVSLTVVTTVKRQSISSLKQRAEVQVQESSAL